MSQLKGSKKLSGSILLERYPYYLILAYSAEIKLRGLMDFDEVNGRVQSITYAHLLKKAEK